MAREDKALQAREEEHSSLPAAQEGDTDLLKLKMQYFGSVAVPSTIVLEALGAGWPGLGLAVFTGVAAAYFTKELHFVFEPGLRITGQMFGLLTANGGRTGRTVHRLTNREWWLGQEIAPYVDGDEEGDEEEVEIDPDILAMLRTGGLESTVSLLERARLAHVEDETGVPSFRKLLEDGVILRLVKKGQMILGYVDEEPRYGTWLDLYSCGIGGVSGSGKSTTVRFLLFQMILGGGHLIMVDPHIGDEEESLAAEFRSFAQHVHLLPPCDDTEKEVVKRVRFLMAEYLMRKQKGIKGPAILFVLDEYNSLVRSLSDQCVKVLAELLLTIAQEGRKFGIFAMIIAQRWSENDLGGKNYGAAIRSSLSSRICHRFADEDQAKRFIGTKNAAKVLELQKGHHLFRDTEGTIREMVTPYTTQADGDALRTLFSPTSKDGRSTSRSTSQATSDISQRATEVGRKVEVEAEAEVLEEDEEAIPFEDFKVTRVREMLKQKASQNEIIQAVWQASGGKKYQEAAAELREIISELI